MKKLFILIATSLLALPAFAQHEASSSSIYTSPNGVVSIGAMNHMSWGYDFVKSDAFKPKGSGEVSLNVLDLNIYPSQSFGFEVGLDCKWQYFGSKESMFYLDGNRIPQAHSSWVLDGVSGDSWKRSTLGDFSLSVPVLAKLYMGKFWIGAGAEANFNLTSYTDYVFEIDNKRTEVSESKGKTNLFTYDFVGLVGFSNTAVFAKFYPKNSTFVPAGGVKFDYWTLGLAIFL